MSRRRESNREYLDLGRHEADRNIPGLIGDLDSQDVDIREHAARVLARFGAKEAAPHIARLADDPVDTARMTAYMALGELRAKEFTGLLLQGLDDPVPVVRMGAAHGLWDMRDPTAIPRLREVLSEEADREVRFRLAYALVKLRDKEIVNDLPEILRDQPWRMRHLSSRWKELKRAADSQELPPTY